MSLFLIKHKEIGNFLHRRYKRIGSRDFKAKWKLKKDQFKQVTYNELMNELYSAKTPIDAASYPNIGSVKNSIGEFQGIHLPDRKDNVKKVLPSYIEVYKLENCINGKINLSKEEI